MQSNDGYERFVERKKLKKFKIPLNGKLKQQQIKKVNRDGHKQNFLNGKDNLSGY